MYFIVYPPSACFLAFLQPAEWLSGCVAIFLPLSSHLGVCLNPIKAMEHMHDPRRQTVHLIRYITWPNEGGQIFPALHAPNRKSSCVFIGEAFCSAFTQSEVPLTAISSRDSHLLLVLFTGLQNKKENNIMYHGLPETLWLPFIHSS